MAVLDGTNGSLLLGLWVIRPPSGRSWRSLGLLAAMLMKLSDFSKKVGPPSVLVAASLYDAIVSEAPTLLSSILPGAIVYKA